MTHPAGSGRSESLPGNAERIQFLSITRRFEELESAYRRECAVGTSMSVHKRYEKRLDELRQRLRQKQSSHHLGEILRQMGAVDASQIDEALKIQSQQQTRKLLGEILIDLGWVSQRTVEYAVEKQFEALDVLTQREEDRFADSAERERPQGG